tara:strand:+ start:206 stop:919 length:714 start_codon:yes stop_codon:yes gene_type:complete
MSKSWVNKVLLSFVVLIVAVLLLVWRSCEQNAQLSAYKKQMQKFSLGDQVFIETENKQGEKVIEQKQIILSQKDAIAHNLLQISELKKVQSQVIIETITKIDSVFIPFDDSWQNENQFDTIVFTDTIYKDNIIYLPKTFSLIEDYYSISGNILKSGVLVDSLRFNNELSLSIGMKSQGVFKKPIPVVIAKNSNPFVETSSMQNIVIKNDLKWYDKKLTWFAVGVLSGFTSGILINNK